MSGKATSIIVGALVVSLATAAHARNGRCVLQVKQKTYLNGRCEVMMTDRRGSFAIGVGETRQSRYFTYVNMEDDGAHGYWNETPDANHAHASLSLLKRNGGCWTNRTARVCAYR